MGGNNQNSTYFLIKLKDFDQINAQDYFLIYFFEILIKSTS